MVQSFERRSGKDRRQIDVEPPLGCERRRSIESRKQEIVEISMSEVEWASYFGQLSQKVDALA